MHNKTKYVIFTIIRIVIITIILLTFFGCGAKSKVTERANQKAAIEISESHKISKVDSVTSSNSINTKTEIIELAKEASIELKQGDPEKEIVLTDPQGNITKIKGADVTISNKEKTTKSKDSTNQENKLIATSNSDTNFQLDIDSETSEKSRTSQVERKCNFLPKIIIISILILILYLIISYFRKSLNPLKWISFK